LVLVLPILFKSIVNNPGGQFPFHLKMEHIFGAPAPTPLVVAEWITTEHKLR